MRNYISTVANISSFMAHQVQDVPLMANLYQHAKLVDKKQYLKSMISNALSVSLAGYSFISSAS